MFVEITDPKIPFTITPSDEIQGKKTFKVHTKNPMNIIDGGFEPYKNKKFMPFHSYPMILLLNSIKERP